MSSCTNTSTFTPVLFGSCIAKLAFNVCFAGPGGILSPVDTGYGSGDGKVALSIDDPGHTVMESGLNELQENGKWFMVKMRND